MDREKTLDLTMFNFVRLGIQIRERHLADYAHDMWKEGYKLSKIRLTRQGYESLKRDLIANNAYIRMEKTGLESIDLGFGKVEIQVED